VKTPPQTKLFTHTFAYGYTEGNVFIMFHIDAPSIANYSLSIISAGFHGLHSSTVKWLKPSEIGSVYSDYAYKNAPTLFGGYQYSGISYPFGDDVEY
jgi:hypothetical protein